MTTTKEERAAFRQALTAAREHVRQSRELCAELHLLKAACACDDALEAIDAEIAAEGGAGQ